MNPLTDRNLELLALSLLEIVLGFIDGKLRSNTGPLRLLLRLIFIIVRLIRHNSSDLSFHELVFDPHNSLLVVILLLFQILKFLVFLVDGVPRLFLKLFEQVGVVLFRLGLVITKLDFHLRRVLLVLFNALVRLDLNFLHEVNNGVFGDVDHSLVRSLVNCPAVLLNLKHLTLENKTRKVNLNVLW